MFKATFISGVAHLALIFIAIYLDDFSSSDVRKASTTVVSVHLVSHPKASGASDQTVAAVPLAKKQLRKKLRAPSAKKVERPFAVSSSSALASKDDMLQGELLSDASSDRLIRKLPILINGDEVAIPYPKKAKLLRVEGTVKLKLMVSKEGKVTNAEIVSGPAFGLRDAALDVASKLAFLPATDNEGFAKDTVIEHEVIFRLTQRS